MQHMRRDSTEKDTAAPVCAMAVTVQRNCIHCEGSQQLFSPAHPEHTPWLQVTNMLESSWCCSHWQEQPRQQRWCFYLVSWKKSWTTSAALIKSWHQFTEKTGFCATPKSSSAPSVIGASLKTQLMVPKTIGWSLFQGHATWQPKLSIFYSEKHKT